jgi:hypothetical protein
VHEGSTIVGYAPAGRFGHKPTDLFVARIVTEQYAFCQTHDEILARDIGTG